MEDTAVLVIVEGCDGSGKTTFVGKLKQRLHDVEVLHRGPPERHPLEEYELDIEDYRPNSGRHVVCDRWHWGEAIYGPLYRGKSVLDPAGMVHVDLFLQARGAVVVYLCANVDVLRRRLRDRGEDYLKDDDLETVVRRYDEVASTATLKPLVLATNADWAVNSVIVAASEKARRAEPLKRFRTYVGPPDPELLLLGERRGNGQKPHGLKVEHQAAFVPYSATSGRYLLESLLTRGLPRVGLANALEEDLRPLYETLGRPKVVTLGRVADAETTRQGIVHGSVPHPQYVRRFHHARKVEYGQLIVRAAEEERTMTCLLT